MKQLILCFLSCYFVLGCSINPDAISKQKLDFILDANYPTKAELKHAPDKMLLVLAPSVELNAGKKIQQILTDFFLTKSNIVVIFKSRLNFEEAINVSRSEGITYTAIIEQSLAANKPKFNIVFYQSFEKQLVAETNWIPSQKASDKHFKRNIAVYFPLKGFIISTKGDRILLKINLGKKLNVKKGDFFAVHSRKIIVETKTNLTAIYTQRKIKYSNNYLARVRVVKVESEYSWALAHPKDSKKIKAGMPIFSFVK